MQPATILTIAIAVTASAHILPRQKDPEGIYLSYACYPGVSQGLTSTDPDDIDLTAPCNAVLNVGWACVEGSQISDVVSDNEYIEPFEFANSTQRDCICSSQFWSLHKGCQDCFQAHGFPAIGPDGDDEFDAPSSSMSSSVSASYCAATNTPTLGIFDVLAVMYPDLATFISTVPSSTAYSTFSDPLGSAATAVSYYYTPAVSGSTIAFVPEATIRPASSGASLTLSISTNSVGQIVPTAGAVVVASKSSSAAVTSISGSSSAVATSTSGSLSAAATSTSAGAGVRVVQQAAGVVAFAGMVAML